MTSNSSEHSEFVKPTFQHFDSVTTDDNKPSAQHIEGIHSVSDDDDELLDGFVGQMTSDANDAAAAEKSMTLIQGLRTYPKAVCWSLILSLCIVMEGYDTNLLANLFAFPLFNREYGDLQSDGSYVIPAHIQTTLAMMVYVGEIVGLAISGIVADKIGYRKSLLIAMFFITCFIFILFFAKSVNQVMAGEFLLGLPWGFMQTLTISYLAEVMPAALRYYLTTYVNLCWVMGQFLSIGVLRAFQHRESHWGFRIVWAIQWIWPIPISIGILLAPESPWWLVKKGKLEQARKSCRRLLTKSETVPDVDLMAEKMVNMMNLTTKLEKETLKEISYWECFRGVDRRRTEIGCAVYIIQNLSGLALISYSTYFYESAGISTTMAFNLSLIEYAVAFIGCWVSWYVSQWLGRFDLYFFGSIIMCCIMFIIGGLGCITGNKAAQSAIGSLLIIFHFLFEVSIGAVCYCLVPEVSSNRLRTKTLILARGSFNLVGIFVAVITPYQLNKTAWNWGAKTGFFWGGISIISITYCWFRLPETKGRSYAELDQLFEMKIHARKFKKTHVDPFNKDRVLEKLNKKSLVNETIGEVDETADSLS